MVARAKWDAWEALGAMGSQDAKKEYCVLVDSFVVGWRSKHGAEETHSGGSPKESAAPEASWTEWLAYGIRYMFKGESLDDEASLMTPDEFLPVAHSIADKFLLLCALDAEIFPLYARATVDLPRLKAQLVEALLSSFRSAFCAGEGVPGEHLSLETHRGLSDRHIDRLRQHLSGAIKEYCSTQAGNVGSVEALSSKLLNAHGIPLTLLPREKVAEQASQALAAKSKGGDTAARVVGGIEFAPLKVPLHRRRQTLACTIGSTLIVECVALCFVCLYFWRLTWPFLLPYLALIFFDRSAWKGGMRMSRWLRRSALFQNWAEYFPASLIKANPEADFRGERPILIGYHPHGILSFGALLNIGTDCTGWAEKFPNLKPRLCTLNVNFRIPFLREIVGRLGCIPASEGSIRSALKPGNAVALVVGGAAEALDTKPGQYVLTLARRKGFFRLALQHGADLVPSFGFGENAIYDTMQADSVLRTFQLKSYKLLSFSMPLFYGRGIFTYNAGPLPYRRPLTTVVGDPIRVEKTPNPTTEQMEALKEQYIAALRQLYAEWQPRLEPESDANLIII